MPDISTSTNPENKVADELFSGDANAATWRDRRHLLDTRDLSVEEINTVLEVARRCKAIHAGGRLPINVLHGKTVANAFYENSTRTRSSFELAARWLGATVLNLDIKVSSVTKGESIVDTTRQLVAMGVHALVQRHSSSGSVEMIVDEFGDRLHVINAGDGWRGHPTQGLLDLFTMIESAGTVRGAKVAIIGDILHSRVARSNFWLLKAMGADVHVSGPPAFLPGGLPELGITVHNRVEGAVEGADFVMALRLQLERQQQGLIPSIGEYKKLYQINRSRFALAKKNAKLLHPGPVNRGIELADDIIDDPSISLIERQVTNGVAVRMAVLALLMGRGA